jgi:hypothetical protein
MEEALQRVEEEVAHQCHLLNDEASRTIAEIRQETEIQTVELRQRASVNLKRAVDRLVREVTA